MHIFFGGRREPSPLHRTGPAIPARANGAAAIAALVCAQFACVLPAQGSALFRSLDGSGQNGAHPSWGAAGAAFARAGDVAYADGFEVPAGGDRPSPRAISNAVCAQSQSIPNGRGASDFLWQWGQFLDHDLDLAHLAAPTEPMPIAVPAGDAWFDPLATGGAVIALSRSAWVRDVDGVRQQRNSNTSWLDGSQVYGSSLSQLLRLVDQDGLLRTSAGDLLPADADGMFEAGDERANEQVGLSAMHTLFVREHNRLARVMRAAGFDATTTLLIVRMVVGAELQAITYREFLPVLLGADALPPYAGYRADVDPTIRNEFATAAFRLGHSLLSPQLLRLDAAGDPLPQGPLPLRAAFFAPELLRQHGIEPLLRGLATQRAQEIDAFVVDDVRNFLFGLPGQGGFDLASLNLQRGRDHGLPGYPAMRRALGLRAPRSFRELGCSPAARSALQSVYADVDQIDLWVGGLAETHAPGAMVGPLFHAILTDQFRRLRDGDPYWYERILPPDMVAFVESMTLARVIRANCPIGAELQDDVFVVPRPRR